MPEQIVHRGFVVVDHMKPAIKLNGKTYHGYWATGVYMQHINRMPSPIGDSVRDSDIDHIIVYSGSADWNMPRSVDHEKVISETVCRRVMAHSKLGDIFEHDIIRFRSVNKLGSFVSMTGEVLLDHHTGTTMIKVGKSRPRVMPIFENVIEAVLGNSFECSLEELSPHTNGAQIVNAEIISEHFENERGLTHFVNLMTEDNQYISFGGLHLCGDACYNWMKKFIDVVGKGSTAHCEGVRVRVKIEDEDIVAIGSINYDDVWLDKRNFMEDTRNASDKNT